MKSVALLLAAVVIAFSFPACAHKSTASCCSSTGSCDAPEGKGTTTSHTHAKKKK